MAKTETKRRPWTPEQVRTLKSLARKKTHAARIAKTLKRSEAKRSEAKALRAQRRSSWVCRWTREPNCLQQLEVKGRGGFAGRPFFVLVFRYRARVGWRLTELP